MGAELGLVKIKNYNFDLTEFVLRRQIMLCLSKNCVADIRTFRFKEASVILNPTMLSLFHPLKMWHPLLTQCGHNI